MSYLKNNRSRFIRFINNIKDIFFQIESEVKNTIVAIKSDISSSKETKDGNSFFNSIVKITKQTINDYDRLKSINKENRRKEKERQKRILDELHRFRGQPFVHFHTKFVLFLFTLFAIGLFFLTIIYFGPYTDRRILLTRDEDVVLLSFTFFCCKLYTLYIIYSFSRDIYNHGDFKWKAVIAIHFILIPSIVFIYIKFLCHNDELISLYEYFTYLIIGFLLYYNYKTGWGIIGRMFEQGGLSDIIAFFAMISFVIIIFLPLYYTDLDFYKKFLFNRLSIFDMYVLEIISGSTFGAIWGYLRGFQVLINK